MRIFLILFLLALAAFGKRDFHLGNLPSGRGWIGGADKAGANAGSADRTGENAGSADTVGGDGVRKVGKAVDVEVADTVAVDTMGWPSKFGFGRVATVQEISALDIAIRPDGKGLPEGSGNVRSGKVIYQVKCAACHGRTGVEGPFMRLVGAMGDTTKAKTIGNYWPYATTLFDYTRRAMPYNAPGSLSADEVYSLTAFLLNANKIIDSGLVVDARSLPSVVMPALQFYVRDDRKGGPEVR